MLRKIVSLTTTLSFMLLIISSIMLYITPEGRVAYWSDWHIIFSKERWGDLHITGGVLFLVFGIWHACLNFKPIKNYCALAFSTGKRNPWPLTLSLLICLFVYAGTFFNVPPMGQLVSWNDEIKEYQAKKYGNPPFGHAENSSLRQFSSFLGLDIAEILRAMKEADFKGNPEPDSIFKTVAAANNMTPQEMYKFILKTTGKENPNLLRGTGRGTGKRIQAN